MTNPEKPITPGLSIKTSEGELILHWFNCRVRHFLDPQFDHVEFTTEDGRLRAIKPTEKVRDFLFENNYPSQFDPVVDEASMTWFINNEVMDLDDEITGLQG